MSKERRAALQVARAILALLTVLWALSLAGGVAEFLNEPAGVMLYKTPWLLLAIAVTLLPAWGYIKLTKILEADNNNKNNKREGDLASVFRATIAGLVSTQLMTSHSKPADAFGELMTNKRAAGYLFGLNDAMLQACGLRENMDDATDLMEGCYNEVFGNFAGHALLSMSLHNQNDPAFHAGRIEGGSEMAEFIENKVPPLGLTRILMFGRSRTTVEETQQTNADAIADVPDDTEFGRLMFEIQHVFRMVVNVPPPEDTMGKVLQDSVIYGAIAPFLYGLAVLKISARFPLFPESEGHQAFRRMVESRMVKMRTETTAGLATEMPKLPDDLVFTPNVVAIRKKVGEELRQALEAVVDGGTPRPRIAAQANLLRAYVSAAPFCSDAETKEKLLSAMSGFVDKYLTPASHFE